MGAGGGTHETLAEALPGFRDPERAWPTTTGLKSGYGCVEVATGSRTLGWWLLVVKMGGALGA